MNDFMLFITFFDIGLVLLLVGLILAVRYDQRERPQTPITRQEVEQLKRDPSSIYYLRRE